MKDHTPATTGISIYVVPSTVRLTVSPVVPVPVIVGKFVLNVPPSFVGAVSYTHLTLPTILLV